MTIKEIPTTILEGIAADLADGMLENDCAIKWCSPATYYRWKKDILKVNEKDEVIDAQGNVLQKDDKGNWIGEPVREFEAHVEKAIVEYKQKLIKAVNINSVKNGLVALETLRRRFPKDWNVPSKIEHGGEVSVAIKKVEDIVDDLLKDENDQTTKITENQDAG